MTEGNDKRDARDAELWREAQASSLSWFIHQYIFAGEGWDSEDIGDPYQATHEESLTMFRIVLDALRYRAQERQLDELDSLWLALAEVDEILGPHGTTPVPAVVFARVEHLRHSATAQDQ